MINQNKREKQVIQNYFSVPCVKYKVFHHEQNRLYPAFMEFRDMEWKKFLVFFFFKHVDWKKNKCEKKMEKFLWLWEKMHITEDIWIPSLDKLIFIWIKPAGAISQIHKVHKTYYLSTLPEKTLLRVMREMIPNEELKK